MSGCRRITERFVRRLVSGVRSSCPASCTSRCCSARDNGPVRRASAGTPPRVARPRRAPYPAPRRRDAPTYRRPRQLWSVAEPVRSPFRRSTTRAPPRRATPPPTRISVRRRTSASTAVDLVERSGDLHGAVLRTDRVHAVAVVVEGRRRPLRRTRFADQGRRRVGDRDVAGERRGDRSRRSRRAAARRTRRGCRGSARRGPAGRRVARRRWRSSGRPRRRGVRSSTGS